MVTQIYTAPIKPYTPNQMGMTSPMGGMRPESSDSLQTPDLSQSSSGLAAIQEQSATGVISIGSVIKDFQSTMDALGVPPEIRQEVMPYLQVIVHQAQKPQPVTGLIKQNLKVSADTLDQYISNALGQKSTVVKEWVDALLMQPINYHSDQPIPLEQPMASANPFSASAQTSDDSGLTQLKSNQLSKSDRDWVKSALQQSKLAFQAQNYGQASASYQEILSRVGLNRCPELAGRVSLQLGKIAERQGQLDEAKGYYEQANQCVESQQLPQLQSKIQAALGNVFLQQGDTDSALNAFKTALSLNANADSPQEQSLIMNQLGILYQQKGDYDSAKENFQQALTLSQQSNTQVTSDILSNLGTLSRQSGNRGEALSYYKQSLQSSLSSGNTQGARQTLNNIAALYLDAGKMEKAYKILENALFRM